MNGPEISRENFHFVIHVFILFLNKFKFFFFAFVTSGQQPHTKKGNVTGIFPVDEADDAIDDRISSSSDVSSVNRHQQLSNGL